MMNPSKVTIDISKLYDEADEPAPAQAAGEFGMKKNLDINIRQIKNGFITRRSWDEPAEDENGRPYDKYMSEEEFSAENPVKTSA